MLSLLLALAVNTGPQVIPASNPICPVCDGTVDGESGVVAVRGQEYRLCCGDCGDPLTQEPDSYLEKDGIPKNATNNDRKPSSPVFKTYLD